MDVLRDITENNPRQTRSIIHESIIIHSTVIRRLARTEKMKKVNEWLLRAS